MVPTRRPGPGVPSTLLQWFPAQFLDNSLPEGPERQGGPCPPRCYGDGVEPVDAAGVGDALGVGDELGGGVRRGLTVGDGVTVGIGVAVGAGVTVGSAVAVGAGVTVGSGVGAGVGLGVGLGVGAGVSGAWVRVGVAVGFGVPVSPAADGAALGAVNVGVTSGATVAPPPVRNEGPLNKLLAANTSEAPTRATTTTVTASVDVVRTAPRKTCVRRSRSQDRRS